MPGISQPQWDAIRRTAGAVARDVAGHAVQHELALAGPKFIADTRQELKKEMTKRFYGGLPPVDVVQVVRQFVPPHIALDSVPDNAKDGDKLLDQYGHCYVLKANRWVRYRDYDEAPPRQQGKSMQGAVKLVEYLHENPGLCAFSAPDGRTIYTGPKQGAPLPDNCKNGDEVTYIKQGDKWWLSKVVYGPRTAHLAAAYRAPMAECRVTWADPESAPRYNYGGFPGKIPKPLRNNEPRNKPGCTVAMRRAPEYTVTDGKRNEHIPTMGFYTISAAIGYPVGGSPERNIPWLRTPGRVMHGTYSEALIEAQRLAEEHSVPFIVQESVQIVYPNGGINEPLLPTDSPYSAF